jgi:nitroreductase
MDAIEAIKNRRSIRKYKTDAVDDKTMEVLLDAARLAPSWANTQCWKFIVVRNDAAKATLADTIASPPTLTVNPAANSVRTAPVVIVACAQVKVSGCFDSATATDKEDYWFMFDVGLAMENLTLAATALGLGSVHVGLFDTHKVEKILGIPAGFRVVEMLPLGYPEFQPKPRPRKELAEIVFHEKFGQA